MSVRPPRFICPYCHSPVDPGRMETALQGAAEYRVCPECDAPVALQPRTPVSRERSAEPCRP